MNPVRAASKDHALREQLLTQLGELETLLGREYDAIRAHDLSSMGSITRAKQTLVDDINDTATAMGSALADLISGNCATSISGMEIRTLITRCQQANSTNGGAIESSQSFTTSLLDILCGRIPGERTYTAGGRLDASCGSSAFVRV